MFMLAFLAQRIMCWDRGGGGKEMFPSYLTFFGALGNCKIIDILQ